MTRWPPFGAPPGAHGGLNQPFGQVVAGQVDIVWAITKSGMRCQAPNCTKPVDPWSATPRNDAPFFSRIYHRVDHSGMRGAPGSNNIVPGFGCAVCARQGRI